MSKNLKRMSLRDKVESDNSLRIQQTEALMRARALFERDVEHSNMVENYMTAWDSFKKDRKYSRVNPGCLNKPENTPDPREGKVLDMV